MYYPELLEIINKTGAKDAIEKLDAYLAFLPNRSEKIITTSNIATKLELDFTIIDMILNFIYDIGLLERIYIARCPECGKEIFTSDKENLIDKSNEFSYCRKCREDVKIGIDDIYVGYKIIKQPNLDEDDIKEETNKLLGMQKEFSKYDELETLRELFEKDKEDPHDFFYKPSEVERKSLAERFASLDFDYGDSKTKQGSALEGLACELFGLCRGMTSTLIMKTPTNQIDCTVRNDLCIPLTVYKELGSIVKVECKNEPEKVPGNTYYHKLYGILSTSKFQNEQAVGILFSRENIASTCKDLARQFFLKDNIIIINICDDDLKRIIMDEKVNFLDVLQEKIQTLKNNIITSPEKHKLYR